jgi:hypothetical protein
MGILEQRNLYRGSPPRPWVRMQLIDSQGGIKELAFIADTGNPFPVIMASVHMSEFKQGDGPDVETNFGVLTAGRVRIAIPELNFSGQVLGYGSDSVRDSVQLSSTDFQGLVGLPLLRMMEYGGDSDWFWLRAKV